MTPEQVASANRILNWFGEHPAIIWWGVRIAAWFVAAWFIRNLLKGGYPADQGVPPRWVGALFVALAPFSLVVKGIGRWLAGKLSFFGFDFLQEKTLPEAARIVINQAKGE